MAHFHIADINLFPKINTIIACADCGDYIEWQRHIFYGNRHQFTQHGIAQLSDDELKKYNSGYHNAK